MLSIPLQAAIVVVFNVLMLATSFPLSQTNQPKRFLCIDKLYSATTHRCCAGKLFKIERGKDCCEGEAGVSLYDKISQYCCSNGLVLDRYQKGVPTDEYTCTLEQLGLTQRIVPTTLAPSMSFESDMQTKKCGTEVYDPENYTCCNGPNPKLVKGHPSKIVCCSGEGHERTNFPCLHEAQNDRLCSTPVNMTNAMTEICKKKYVYEIKMLRQKSSSTIKAFVRELRWINDSERSKSSSKRSKTSRRRSKVNIPIDQYFPCSSRPPYKRLTVFSDVDSQLYNDADYYIYTEDIITSRINGKRLKKLRRNCRKG